MGSMPSAGPGWPGSFTGVATIGAVEMAASSEALDVSEAAEAFNGAASLSLFASPE
jgi:hypothetical protein